jgi:methyl-accepting chemotaxis protein
MKDRAGRNHRSAICGRKNRNAVLWLLTPLLAFLWGCEAPKPAGPVQGAKAVPANAQAELREELDAFVGFFQQTVEQAAMRIARESSLRQQQQAAATWRVRVGRLVRSAADQTDAREALLDLWVLSERMHSFLAGEEGREIFGEYQTVAVDAAERIRNRIEQLATRYVPEDSFEKTQGDVKQYASAHPMRRDYAEPAAGEFSDVAAGRQIVNLLVGVPLAPFTTLTNVQKGAESVSNLSGTADRFTDVVQDLPAELRWQLQLLALNLEDTETVSSVRASLKQMSDSSARFASAAEQMPEQVRTQAEILLDRMDESQPEMRSTLSEARDTAEAMRAATREVRETGTALEGTLRSMTEAAGAVQETANVVERATKEIAAIEWKKARPEGTPPEPRGEPFSFQAVTQSADAVTMTAGEMRQLLQELRELLDSDPLQANLTMVNQQVDEAVGRSGAELRTVVDHGAWRAAQLLALGFVLLVVYRVIAVRLIGGRSDLRPR